MTVRETLERVYEKYHKEEYIYPDPLFPVRKYKNRNDREIVALIASSLALGRVELILKAIDEVLGKLGNSPAKAIAGYSLDDFREIYKDFVYRFFRREEISFFLFTIGKVLREKGSVEDLFIEKYEKGKGVLPGIANVSSFFEKYGEGKTGMLVPDPSKGSACKRFNLFLRWMVRCDDIDPGGWDNVLVSDLIVPLDTHMFDISRRMRFTCRRSGDLKTALEVTSCFAGYSPEDPTRYDFSLTRLGIHPDFDKTIFNDIKF